MIDRSRQFTFLVQEPGVGQSINYMTKPALAERLCDLAEIQPFMRVLEPSAGTGIIAEIARGRGATVECVELNADFANILRKEGFTVFQADFLNWRAGHLYDRIVMNPPFVVDGMADLEHIKRAWGWLKYGGKLVSVVNRTLPENPAFIEWLARRNLAATSDVLPDDAYGLVPTAVVVIHES